MPPFVPPPFILMFLSSTNWFIWEKITNPLFGLDPLHGSNRTKNFFRKTVHTVHCAFLFIKFIMLHGERLVNSEHFTVHFCRFAGKKRPAMPVREVISLWGHRISAASRRCFPLLAPDWSVCPDFSGASHNLARTLSAWLATPYRT